MADSKNLPTPPVAKSTAHRTSCHGQELVDPYHWLRDPKYPEVTDEEILAYLKAENAYVSAYEKTLDGLPETIFAELKGRLVEDDEQVPYRKGADYFQLKYEKGKQYRVFQRRKGSETGSVEVLLDQNQLAEGKDFLSVRDMDLSPNETLLGYSVDFDGSERYELRFRELATGKDIEDSIPNTQGGVLFSADSTHVYYAHLDEQLRPSRVYRHKLGSDWQSDELVYEEKDPSFWLGLGLSSDERLIVIHTQDKETSEAWYLPRGDNQGKFTCFSERKEGLEYDIDHRNGEIYVRANDKGKNFRLYRVGLDDGAAEAELLVHNSDVFLKSFFLFEKHLIVFEREGGLPQVRVMDLAAGSSRRLSFPDAAYTVGPGTNAEYRSDTLRLSYQSLVTPSTVLDINLVTDARQVKKVQQIPSGYDASQYTSERRTATAEDGTEIPYSLVYHKTKRQEKGPVYLYAYGSYGATIDPYFSTNRLSLLDRGFMFVLAHVRGGSDMGRSWYEDGKRFKKKNTFTDTIAIAKDLVARGDTQQGEFTVSGGSAGGMLVGAVINQAPELFRAAVASVPFVDCLNTMLDGSLPLTPTEYTEWGNPEADPAAFDYIRSYSPYDNVKAQAYPHLLITAGLSDPRVTYWEPAKWAAKLRATKTGDHLLMLKTNMSAGHGGASGRYDSLKELAFEFAFLLERYGLFTS